MNTYLNLCTPKKKYFFPQILLIFGIFSTHLSTRKNQMYNLEVINLFSNQDEEYSKNIILERNDQQNFTNCSKKICDSIGGECLDHQTCKCKDGFTTFLRNNNMKLCNYQKISSVNAAFIELFLGFGLGHLYCDRKIYGMFKLFFSSLMCCLGCCAVAMGVKLEGHQVGEEPNSAVIFFNFIYVCILNFLVLWQISDFVLFIFKIYTDGNEIPLY